MKIRTIENIVAAELDGATETFLQEIVDHGIHNLTNNFQGENDAEYEEYTQEFNRQARAKLDGE